MEGKLVRWWGWIGIEMFLCFMAWTFEYHAGSFLDAWKNVHIGFIIFITTIGLIFTAIDR